MPVLSSGFVHPSALKALAILGIGRETVRTFSRDAAGRLDLPALEAALRELDGAPAIVVGNAGEVNAGEFDPLEALADLAEEHGAWLHVDGAFGLFAASRPARPRPSRRRRAGALGDRGRPQVAQRPVRLRLRLRPRPGPAREGLLAGGRVPPVRRAEPTYGYLTPESSRRARSLAVWATLRAWGRAGYRELVERHLDLAQRLAARVDEADDLERLADVPLNIVCFRYRPPGVPEEELDALNARLGEEVLADGRVYVGTTSFAGKTAFRPAIVNWRTREADIDLLVDVLRELGSKLLTRTK